MLTPRRTFELINAAVVSMLHRIEQRDGQPFDLEQEMSHVTADAIFRALFSDELTEDVAKQLFDAFQNYQSTLPTLSIKGILGLPEWFPGGVSRQGKKHARKIREILGSLISQRIEEGSEPDDLLQKLLTTTDASGQHFTRTELVDELAILFLAGHETTASSLCWTILLTKKTPSAAEELNKALDQYCHTGHIDHGALLKLDIARNLFSEGLRLYPPVPFITRELTEPRPMRDWVMRKNSMVVVSPWLVQRHRKYWHRPDAFLPGRFSRKAKEKVNKKAYLPFGVGPRVCPGAAFATIEGPLIIASLFKYFDFELRFSSELRPICRLTTRPSEPIAMRVTAKKQTLPPVY